MNIRNLALVFAAFFIVSCDPKQEAAQPAETAAAPAQAATAQTKEMKPVMDTLKDPSKAVEKAPDTFKVKFNTTKGDFTLEINRSWAPLGADRFYNLVKAGFFTDLAFFRVIEGFMVQFGIHGDPSVAAAWRGARIQDDPVKESNKPGYITYAMAGPNTRTTQFFINYGNNARLDGMGFSPFGKVTEGMDVVNSIYNGYGEGAPSGMGPDQGMTQMKGNAYLKADFPKMDYIKSAQLLN
jgi:peptidyl-prolyl cis-trans isomerase A (cyclophilin A)